MEPDEQGKALNALGELYYLVGALLLDATHGRANTATISATALDDLTQRAIAAIDAWLAADAGGASAETEGEG